MEREGLFMAHMGFDRDLNWLNHRIYNRNIKWIQWVNMGRIGISKPVQIDGYGWQAGKLPKQDDWIGAIYPDSLYTYIVYLPIDSMVELSIVLSGGKSLVSLGHDAWHHWSGVAAARLWEGRWWRRGLTMGWPWVVRSYYPAWYTYKKRWKITIEIVVTMGFTLW
jgi:hypothetical protein